MDSLSTPNRRKALLSVVVLLLIATLACGESSPSSDALAPIPTATGELPATEATPTESAATPTAPPTATTTVGPTPDTTGCSLGARFQSDVTIPDGTELAAGETFTKTWGVRNTGTCPWGPGYLLVFTEGDLIGGPPSVPVPETAPGGVAAVSVALTAPLEDGRLRGNWQLCAGPDRCFGDKLYVQIKVYVPPTPTPTPGPTPTATPAPPLYAEVLNVTPHQGTDGDLWLYGEVRNGGLRHLRGVEILATLYDEDGKVLATDTGYVSTPLQGTLWHRDVLYSGEVAPFRILFESAGQWKDWKITLEYAEATISDYDDHYPDLELLSHQGRAIDAWLSNYRVSGEIQNVGQMETGNVRMTVTLYDSQDRVVGIGDMYMTEDDTLLPGEVVPFAVDIYARGTVSSYRILYRSVKH